MYEKYETLLKLRGVKTAQVSRETGIPPSTFTDWKKGRVKNISPSSLKKIADYFEIPVSYFYEDDENKELNKFLTIPVVSKKRGGTSPSYINRAAC